MPWLISPTSSTTTVAATQHASHHVIPTPGGRIFVAAVAHVGSSIGRFVPPSSSTFLGNTAAVGRGRPHLNLCRFKGGQTKVSPLVLAITASRPRPAGCLFVSMLYCPVPGAVPFARGERWSALVRLARSPSVDR